LSPHLPTRATDLLEQIEQINPVIDRHIDSLFMRDQYKRHKQEWVDELAAILRGLKLLDGGLIAT
jgi:hypothetical protein